MTTIKLSPGALPLMTNPLPLGIRGENEITQVEFDFAAWADAYGSGVVSLLIRRPGDSAAYPVTLAQSGTTATWTVTATDLAARGRCTAEYAYTVGAALKKSCVFYYFVAEDIGSNGPAPDPYEEWLATLTALAAETQQAALDAEAASQAIQDMSVEAEALEPGAAPTVTKTVDPETGAVTLVFGLPESGGGGGTSDYDDLTDKPQIEGVTLSGNKTLPQLGIVGGSVSPEMYGAAGDGETNDTQAVQDAIDSGKTVVMTGTYSVTSVVVKNTDIVLEGTVLGQIIIENNANVSGGTIQQSTNNPCVLMRSSAANGAGYMNSSLRNTTLIPASDGIGIELYADSNALFGYYVSNVDITSCEKSIYIYNNKWITKGTFENVYCHTPTYAIYIDNLKANKSYCADIVFRNVFAQYHNHKPVNFFKLAQGNCKVSLYDSFCYDGIGEHVYSLTGTSDNDTQISIFGQLQTNPSNDTFSDPPTLRFFNFYSQYSWQSLYLKASPKMIPPGDYYGGGFLENFNSPALPNSRFFGIVGRGGSQQDERNLVFGVSCYDGRLSLLRSTDGTVTNGEVVEVTTPYSGAVYTTATLPANAREGATCFCSDILGFMTRYGRQWNRVALPFDADLDDIPDGDAYKRATAAQLAQIAANAGDIDAIEGKIPAAASSSNQLADKTFVTDSITQGTAIYRGSYATKAALLAVSWQTSDPTADYYVSNNDYAVVLADETHSNECWRYLYVTGTGWTAQYRINESPLTQAQLDALNSGATAAIIGSVAEKYVKPSGGIPASDLASAVQTSLGKADTALQSAPVTSVNGKTGAVTLNASDVGALPASTKYAASQSAGGAADKAVSIPTGTVDDTSTSTAFTATVSGITELRDGVCVWLTNGVVTSAAGCTLDINSLGAKPIYNSIAAATATTTAFNINYTMLFVYNSSRVTGGCWDIVYGYDSNTTYTLPKLGCGYTTCSTAAATAAKTASLSSYALTTGGYLMVKFTNAVGAGATLNVNSKGAKALYYQGAAITDGVIKAGDTVLLCYSTQYHVVAIDRWGADIAAKYTKPSGGIPASDLASAVQTSLGKADTAIPAPASPTSGQYLSWNGSAWVAQSLPLYNGGVS